jgi:hypothetical protein
MVGEIKKVLLNKTPSCKLYRGNRMKQNKTHIPLLALFQLMLFMAPFTVKATHHHIADPFYISLAKKGEFVSTAQDPCYVCHFEFVTFIALHGFGDLNYNSPDDQFCVEPIQSTPRLTTLYYSLRAPPAC